MGAGRQGERGAKAPGQGAPVPGGRARPRQIRSKCHAVPLMQLRTSGGNQGSSQVLCVSRFLSHPTASEKHGDECLVTKGTAGMFYKVQNKVMAVVCRMPP